MRRLRTIATGLILAAGLALGLLPAAAHAAGPGATLFINTSPRPIDVPGDRFSGGLALSSLLAQYGVALETVSFVTVSTADGGLITLQKSAVTSPPAVIFDNGAVTRFVRNASPRQEVRATAESGPLQINVDAGDIPVTASASPASIEAGQTVTLSASVRFAPPGAQLDFEWDFGDGSAPKTGTTVRHVYRVGGSSYPARVTVRGSGGSTQRCATTCTGTDSVDVTVGDPPPEPPPAPGAGSGGGSGGGSAAGSGAGGGQGGQGGTGGGTGTGATPSTETPAIALPKPPPPPPKKPKPKKPFGVTISGVLINDPGTTISKLPAGRPAGGAPEGRRRTQGSDAGTTFELPAGGLLALAFFTLGALRERRGVRLRLA